MTTSNSPAAQQPSALGLTTGTIDLSGKQALVCGASQGIGEAIARQLAAQGAAVILLARSADRLASLADEIAAESSRASSVRKPAVVPLDLGDEERTRTAIARLTEERGTIHIAINNAGGPAPGPILEAKLDALKKGFAEHVLASQLLASLLVPGMKAAGYGRIINIISISAKQPISNLGVSNTIRAAMSSWAKTLAGELAPHGITVNNVLPGYTDTPRLRSLLEATAARSGRSVEAVTQEWRSLVPAARFAEPAEIAAAVGFLASPAASYITGIHLPVDGGRLSTL